MGADAQEPPTTSVCVPISGCPIALLSPGFMRKATVHRTLRRPARELTTDCLGSPPSPAPYSQGERQRTDSCCTVSRRHLTSGFTLRITGLTACWGLPRTVGEDSGR